MFDLDHNNSALKIQLTNAMKQNKNIINIIKDMIKKHYLIFEPNSLYVYV